MENTIYANGVSVKETKYSLKTSFNVERFIEFLQEHKNEKGYVNTEIKKRKEPGKYGDTHFMALDTWKPEVKEEKEVQEQSPTFDNKGNVVDDDSLPF